MTKLTDEEKLAKKKSKYSWLDLRRREQTVARSLRVEKARDGFFYVIYPVRLKRGGYS